MMKAIVADPVGGPENLKLVELPDPEPKPDEVLVKLEFVGVNFIDVNFRTGLYKAPESPVRLGSEASGIVVRPDAGNTFRAGDRVAYTMVRGSYAEFAAVPVHQLVRLPDTVTFEQAAAVMLQGMTAHYLTHSTFKLEPGQTCLVHAASGGTGLLLVQMAKIIGANVIGTVSTSAKAQLATEHGADHTILYTETDFVAEVKRLTHDKGVDVVYDSVGADTFLKSLDCLRPRGMAVSFGQSSGPIADFSPLLLVQKGSLFVTRPSLANYVSDRAELEWRSNDLFRWLADGKLRLRISKTYALTEVASAHRDLEGRVSTGKLLLKP